MKRKAIVVYEVQVFVLVLMVDDQSWVKTRDEAFCRKDRALCLSREDLELSGLVSRMQEVKGVNVFVADELTQKLVLTVAVWSQFHVRTEVFRKRTRIVIR